MALGTATVVGQYKKSASAPLDVVQLSFAGDTAYPEGGTTEFQAYVRAALGRDVSVAGVIKAAATGVYTPIYDVANDTLYVEDQDGVQVVTDTDLQATTFSFLVFCY